MQQAQSAVIHQCCPTHTETIGAYRFLTNPRVTMEMLSQALVDPLAPAAAGKHVLCIQDTTEINYTAHSGRLKASDEHLGPVAQPHEVGFFLHPSLVVDAATGLALGYSDVHLWTRSWEAGDKHARAYKDLPIEQKESYRWLAAAERSKQTLAAAEQVTLVADREADIYALLSRVPDARTHLVIRAAQPRRVQASTASPGTAAATSAAATSAAATSAAATSAAATSAAATSAAATSAAATSAAATSAAATSAAATSAAATSAAATSAAATSAAATSAASVQPLDTYLATLPWAGSVTVAVRASAKRRAREARLGVRFAPVQVLAPRSATSDDAASVALYALEVVEAAASVPAGEDPIRWCLLTTHPVTTLAEALRVVDYYKQRWQIEQVFRLLKRKGLALEASQLTRGAALQKLCVLALQIALVQWQLVSGRDGASQQPATLVFTVPMLALLRVMQAELEGRTAKQQCSHAVGSLAWASWIVGRLGGWKGYASQSPPGPITMRRGLERLLERYAGWQLAQQMYTPQPG